MFCLLWISGQTYGVLILLFPGKCVKSTFTLGFQIIGLSRRYDYNSLINGKTLLPFITRMTSCYRYILGDTVLVWYYLCNFSWYCLGSSINARVVVYEANFKLLVKAGFFRSCRWKLRLFLPDDQVTITDDPLKALKWVLIISGQVLSLVNMGSKSGRRKEGQSSLMKPQPVIAGNVDPIIFTSVLITVWCVREERLR